MVEKRNNFLNLFFFIEVSGKVQMDRITLQTFQCLLWQLVEEQLVSDTWQFTEEQLVGLSNVTVLTIKIINISGKA